MGFSMPKGVGMGQENVGCLGFLFRLFPGLQAGGEGGDGAPARAEVPKVMMNKYFVSNAEADFLRVLRAVVGDHGHVLVQASLKRLVYFPSNGNLGRQRWRNKVAQKSVDFVICDPNTPKPKVVIELDEPSHMRPDRQMRDEDVEETGIVEIRSPISDDDNGFCESSSLSCSLSQSPWLAAQALQWIPFPMRCWWR